MILSVKIQDIVMDLSQEFTSAEGLKTKQDRAKQSLRLLMVFLDENVQFLSLLLN